jgi:hypothetical protein
LKKIGYIINTNKTVAIKDVEKKKSVRHTKIVFLFCGVGVRTQDLAHASEVLYH